MNLNMQQATGKRGKRVPRSSGKLSGAASEKAGAVGDHPAMPEIKRGVKRTTQISELTHSAPPDHLVRPAPICRG